MPEQGNYDQWIIKAGEGGTILGREGEVLQDGWYMYVLDRDNNIRYLPTAPTPTSNKPFDQYRAHTQLAGGENVWGAGTFKVTDGRLQVVDTGSGHYKPSSEYLEYTKVILEKQGFDISSTTFQTFKPARPWYHPKELQRLALDFTGAVTVGTRRIFGQQIREERPTLPPELEDLLPY